MKTAIVIGAGLAGLSLATELAQEGFQVTVLEKNNYLGGRASNSIDEKTKDAVPIGPHVFVSCYFNFFKFLQTIGAEQAIEWDDKVLVEFIHDRKHHQYKIHKRLGKFYIFPWILQNPLLSWKDKVSTIRATLHTFSLSQKAIEKLDSMTAYEYLRRQGVSENTINFVYRFVGLSLINIPLEYCSAAEFVWLLKEWLRFSPLHFGFAKVGLGDLYTHQALSYVKKRKGTVVSSARVKDIIFEGDHIQELVVNVDGKDKRMKADVYVSTATPIELRSFLPQEVRFNQYFRHLNAFEGVPYFSVNLWFDRKISSKKFWALLPTSDTPTVMNTDFYDQSNIYTKKREYSFVTSNVIYSKPYTQMSDAEIVKKTLSEVYEAFPDTQAKLVHSQVNRLPYVIYIPYPGMRKHKLGHTTPYTNFFLSGDWTVKKTQCMETAVISGYLCAEEILRKYGIEKKIYSEKGF